MWKKIVLIISVLFLCSCGKVTYYCINGELDGNECIISSSKEATSTCREGYTKVGYVCKERTEASGYTVCDEGYVATGNTCISEDIVARESTYTCDKSNYKDAISVTLKDNVCVVKTCDEYDGDKCVSEIEYEDNASLNVGSCPRGTEEVYGECHKVRGGRTTYTCNEGTLSGKYCILDNSVGVSYSCDSDDEELVGYECISKTRVPAKQKEN